MVEKEELKSLLRNLRSEADLSKVKDKAKQFLKNVDPKVLSLAEQELVEEGMSREELRRLCDIHLQLLSGGITEVKVGMKPTHPIAILKEEHEIILKNLDKLEGMLDKAQKSKKFGDIEEELEQLEAIAHVLRDAESHHDREEKALFPHLEKHGITGPPSIMRMEHIELKKRKKALGKLIEDRLSLSYEEFKDKLQEISEYILKVLRDHIFKENNILYPTALESLQDDEWNEIKTKFDSIGYCCFTPHTSTDNQNQKRGKDKPLDLRRVNIIERHAVLFDELSKLKVGESLTFINDHEPRPLYPELAKRGLSYKAKQESAEKWIINVTREK